MFNYPAKERLLPIQLSENEILLTRTKLWACYLDNKDVVDMFY